MLVTISTTVNSRNGYNSYKSHKGHNGCDNYNGHISPDGFNDQNGYDSYNSHDNHSGPDDNSRVFALGPTGNGLVFPEDLLSGLGDVILYL